MYPKNVSINEFSETVKEILQGQSIESKYVKNNFNDMKNTDSFCFDLGLDSLDIAETIVKVEQKYHVSIPYDDNIDTVNGLYNAFNKSIQQMKTAKKQR